MEFVESHAFSRQAADLLPEDQFGALQRALIAQPAAGALIAGTGGCRKLRWAADGRGKSGGVRVIYYHVIAHHRVHLLAVYAKKNQSDLTPAQCAALRAVVALLT